MASATVLIKASGPLPLTANFDGGGVLLVSGSGYTSSGTANIGMQIFLDGDDTDQGPAQIWANPANTHLSFVSQYIPVGEGSHTLELSPLGTTTTDGNDNFMVLLLRPEASA